MHEPHSSGVRRITHFVRVEVVMLSPNSCFFCQELWYCGNVVLPEETFNYLHIASSVGKGVQFPLMMGLIQGCHLFQTI